MGPPVFSKYSIDNALGASSVSFAARFISSCNLWRHQAQLLCQHSHFLITCAATPTDRFQIHRLLLIGLLIDQPNRRHHLTRSSSPINLFGFSAWLKPYRPWVAVNPGSCKHRYAPSPASSAFPVTCLKLRPEPSNIQSSHHAHHTIAHFKNRGFAFKPFA